MKKGKICWLVISLGVVLALLVASCAPAPKEVAPAVKEVAPAVKEAAPAVKEAAPAVKEAAPAVKEAPKYGGVLRLALRTRVLQISQTGTGGHSSGLFHQIVGDSLFTQDWAKGPSGTGEIDYEPINIIHPTAWAPALAESWEMPNPETIIVHLRKGVRFHNKPPVNGRELDATDVVKLSMRLYWEVNDHNNRAFEAQRKAQAMKALDKYTVEMKILPGMQGEVIRVTGDWNMIEPRELFERYGGLKEWSHLIGTGPFMLKDHVEESSTTFVRNPDYWETDPYGPGKGNQLPYFDGLVFFCIPDISTRLAALRTGKIDQVEWLKREQLKDLLRDAPQLKTRGLLSAGITNGIAMRNDTPPFSDVRVRRALSMAIDREAIGRDLYGGDYNLFITPVSPMSAHLGRGYTPLKELPPSAREIYEYHPDKARQLLAEAGYPRGFKTEALAYASEQIDMLSIVKEYFAKIGVELTIDVKEFGVYSTTLAADRQKAMVCQGISAANPFRFHPYRSRNVAGRGNSMVNDPLIDKLYLTTETPVSAADWDAKSAEIKAIVPHIVEQAYYIELPSPFEYIAWWPWLQNYSGETGIYQHRFQGTWARYSWIDQALKKTLGK